MLNPLAMIRTAAIVSGWIAAGVFAVQIYGLPILVKGYRAELRDAETAFATQKLAHEITLQSLAALTTSLEAQTAMVREWGRVADERRNAARIALGKAVERAKRSEAAVIRIDLERARRVYVGPICPTSEAVMAARTEL